MAIVKKYASNDKQHAGQKPLDGGGLTTASREFAQHVLQFAQDNDMSFDEAARYLMRETRHYAREISATTSPISEIAGTAKTVSANLKIDYIDALRQVAAQHPGQVRQIADQWLLETARTAARGTPGVMQSEAEATELRRAIGENPDVAAARLTGTLSESAFRKIFWSVLK
jgi:hypothetical protein